MNQTLVTITGRLTRRPELRTASTGRSYLEVDVAVNRRRRNDAEEWEDGTPTFHTVRAFDRLADNLTTLDKGHPVIIVGEMITDAWTDKTSGETRTKAKILASAGGPDYSAHRATPEAATPDE